MESCIGDIVGRGGFVDVDVDDMAAETTEEVDRDLTGGRSANGIADGSGSGLLGWSTDLYFPLRNFNVGLLVRHTSHDRIQTL